MKFFSVFLHRNDTFVLQITVQIIKAKNVKSSLFLMLLSLSYKSCNCSYKPRLLQQSLLMGTLTIGSFNRLNLISLIF